MNIIDFKCLSISSSVARLRHFSVGIATFLLSVAMCQVQAAVPSQTPLFLSVGAKPHIALVMSVDHELFKKAYTDYANLDGNKLEMKDTTYRDDFDYYGYFDSDWCYSYTENASSPIDSYYTPHSKAVAPSGSPTGTKTHQCVGAAADTWSGNFLNWLSMSRMDIVRRVLFGGARAVGGDTAGRTVLERAYLPKDVHAFAKVYGSNTVDITPYTPSSFVTGNTYSFCNVSTSDDVSTGYPVIRAASGAWPLWATVESAYFDGNCSLATSGTLMPSSVMKDYTAKVEACVSGKNATITVGTVEEAAPRCRKYGNDYKPSGLLQKYGEDGQINFSLMSGSYKANHKGGVLRKAAGPLVGSPANNTVDEINIATGQFNNVPGIIRNVSKFRISTYKFNTKIYADCNSWSIPITDFTASSNSGRRCRDWGNPISEIYMETLRYIAGKMSPTAAFDVDDSTAEGNYPGIAGLSKTTWNDPWPTDQYCAKCSVIVLSTGSNSFDGDDLGGITDLPGMTAALLTQKTDSVGTQEYGSFGAGKEFFMGGLDSKSRYCKSFSLTGLSGYTGICPELPALEGTYAIAGLAHYARTTDLRPTLSDGPGGIYKQKVNTYAVDLAETIPTIPLVVNGNNVRILPACESNIGGSAVDESASDPWSTCSLFDVKIHSLTYSGNDLVSGSMSFYWEDSLWGYDYDLDVEQRLDFCVGPTAQGCNDASVGAAEIRIVNTIPYAEAGNALRLSYSIYGVSNFSGTWTRNSTVTTIASTAFSGGLVSPWMLRPGGRNYTSAPIPNDVGTSTFKFVAATSTVELPKKPLHLAAKYGGFTDLKKNEVTNAPLVDDQLDYVKEWDNYKGLQDTIPDNFFSVKNPALLEESLDNIFTNILRKTSSASAVATSSTRLQEGQFVYQAIFDSSNWSGELRSFEITSAGSLSPTPKVTTRSININTQTPTAANRKVVTYKSDGTFASQNADGSSRDTVAFLWSNLHASQQAKLALTGDAPDTDQKRLNWLQGWKTYEDPIAGLRVRDYEDTSGAAYRNIIGDIVNSSPAFVGSFNYRYYGLPVAQGGDKYSDYLQWKRGLASPTSYPVTPAPRIFVGSNGGMLHSLHADTLQEIFAYVPNATFHKLAKLTERDYGTSANQHQYLVDGPIVSGDAFISTPTDSTKKWRSIVVGTFGAGAKGIYALDVTAENAPEVLFEYSHADMGYILGRPVIVPTASGRWAVVVGNGIDTGTNSKLFVVDLEQPYSETKILNTGAGTGLSAPAVITNAAGIATTVYAGDLSGNMRRFNIGNTSPGSWNSYRVFRARTAGSVNQPIVASPTIGYNSKLGRNMVYFGTGKYHDAVDKNVGSIRHSIYGVPDMGATGTAATRANLLQKTMTTSYTSLAESRVVSTVSPDWVTKIGWYIDLDYSVASKLDERVTVKPILIQDRLLVTTLIPSDANCLPGGSSWFMEITAVGDHPPPPQPPISQYSSELILGDPTLAIINPNLNVNSSASVPTGSASSAASSNDNCGEDAQGKVFASGSGGGGVNETDTPIKLCSLGRQSWQQLK